MIRAVLLHKERRTRQLNNTEGIRKNLNFEFGISRNGPLKEGGGVFLLLPPAISYLFVLLRELEMAVRGPWPTAAVVVLQVMRRH